MERNMVFLKFSVLRKSHMAVMVQQKHVENVSSFSTLLYYLLLYYRIP